MAARIAAHDWSQSPLGAREAWSPALLTTVGLMLPAQAQIVLFWGPEYVALYNDAYAPTIGDKHPRALGRPARENWSELWADLEPLLRGVRETGRTFFAKDRPFYIERSGGLGETVYFDVSYSLVREADGSPGGVFCIVSETTERVRAQEKLGADHDRFAEMFRQAPSFMAQLDGPQHMFTLANDAYRQLIGGRDVVGKSLREALPDLEGQGFYELMDNVYRSGEPFVGRAVPVTLERDNGPVQVLLDFVYQPIKAADGSVTGIFVEGIDVTEQHAAADIVRRSEERVRLATENAGVGLFDIEPDEGIDFSYSRTGSSFIMAQGGRVQFAYLLSRLHPDDAPLMRTAYDNARDPAQRGRMDVEYRVLPEFGRPERWIRVRGRGVFDADGNCQRVSGTAMDITSEKKIEREIRELNDTLEKRVVERTAALEKSQAALQQAQKMEAIGNLTGGIAHDFNNLLQGLTGSLDLIRRKSGDEKVQRWADAGLQAAARGTKLTSQLLSFSRLQKLELKPVDLSSLLNGMRDLLGRTLGPSIQVALDLSPDVGAVLGDETQLEMAVLNLAINGRDAMQGKGTLTIRTHPVTAAPDSELGGGAFVELSVTDTGVGMAPDIVARAFDPFFTTKDLGKGTGLGLSQVYGMARQAGGTARIHSQSGKGTTVSLLLRRTDQRAQADDGTPSKVLTPSAPATVLVVDDDPGVVQFLTDALDASGYVVVTASDGAAGLDLLERMRPDLLIVDYAMPGMTGAQLAAQARTRHPDLPVLFASGYAQTDEVEKALDGKAPILRKPFRLDELQAAVIKALRPDG